uniref:Uncharacterized protein n=1 Tax=Brassica oleracea TaxID=3712 RepID=A0A3P6A0J8_BRAOL|nr:unnamed protein product [Brassica oleracea]
MNLVLGLRDRQGRRITLGRELTSELMLQQLLDNGQHSL